MPLSPKSLPRRRQRPLNRKYSESNSLRNQPPTRPLPSAPCAMPSALCLLPLPLCSLRLALIRPLPPKPPPDRQPHNLEIEPHGPTLDVLHVERHPFFSLIQGLKFTQNGFEPKWVKKWLNREGEKNAKGVWVGALEREFVSYPKRPARRNGG